MRKIGIALMLATTASWESALAFTEAELLERLAGYQQRIDMLSARLAEIEGVADDGFEERVADLEKDMSRQQRRSRGLEERVDRGVDRLRIQGFGSAGVAVLDDGNATYVPVFGEGIDDRLSYIDSIAGVQFDFRVSDQVSFTTQLVGRTTDGDFNVGADWAYLSWHATDSLTLRGGRMRIPMFMLSDYLDVGYTYPWARPPEEVYNLARQNIDRYEGFDVLWSYEAGPVTGMVQALVGRANPVTEQYEMQIRDMWGLIGFANVGDFSFRAGYLAADVGVGFPSGSPLEQLDGVLADLGLARLSPEDGGSFASVGFQYDNGALLVTGEYARLELDGPLTDADSWYLGGGYRFGRFMPYGYLAQYETQDDDERLAIQASLNTAAADFEAQAAGLAATETELQLLVDQLDAGTTPLFDPATGLLLSSALDPVLPDPTNAELAGVFNLEGARSNLASLQQGLTELNAGALGLRQGGAGLVSENLQQRSAVLGLRFEPAGGVAVKLQWDYVHDTDGNGLGSGQTADDFSIFSLVIDTVF